MINSFENGRLASVTRQNAASGQIGATTHSYDGHGRLSAVADARNGTTSYTYGNADRPLTATTPAPGNGQNSQTTTTAYDNMGRVKTVTQPDSTAVTNEFFATGLLKKTSGSRTYPVEYTYDPQGRMKTMKTWTNFSSGTGAATTTWNYDTTRGFLLNKRDPNSQGCDYTYTAAGRLKTRTWARTGTSGSRILTTYTYGIDDGVSANDHGDLLSIVHSYDPASTPSTTYTYDRRGRQVSCLRNSITTTRYLHDAGHLLGEAYSGGTLNGLALTNLYDSYFRRTQVTTKNGGTTLSSSSYTYDNASRIASVTDGSYSANYTYLANSPLVSQIDFKQSTTLRMSTVKSYDYLNRLSSIASHPGGIPSPTSVNFAYQYNDANQRTRMTLADGSYWLYEYDTLGQVKAGKRYWSDHIPVPGQQFEYGFDDIGNRTTTKGGGDSNGANLRSATYTANSRNQYTSRTVPNGFDVLGIANQAASVSVNSSATDYRRGEYFQEPVTVSNSSAAIWESVGVTALNGGSSNTVTGHVFLPQTAESPTYDADGNATQDGRWVYTWDAENRLTQIESLSSNPTASKRKVVWEYDCRGRRVRQTTYDGSSGSYVATSDLKFLFDGWRCVAELNASNNALLRSYSWGLDLSGSLDGAGGVGGLTMINSVANGVHSHAMDGNGNVVALVKGSDATVSANYEFDPFGQSLRATGTMALENPYRFSTKRTDNTSDLVLYEYRAYSPSLGRWLNRDPVAEKGGANLYGFVGNSPLNGHDPFGESPNWHHLLPQASGLATFFAAAGLDINAAEYGWIVDSECHTGKGGLHPAWNNEWEAFKSASPAAKKEAILQQLSRMKNDPRFKSILGSGQEATLDYNAWTAALRKARREAVEAACRRCATTGGKKVVKKLPVLGLVFIVSDIHAKGPVGGTCNTLLDACPVVGWVKLTELVTGDWIPDVQD